MDVCAPRKSVHLLGIDGQGIQGLKLESELCPDLPRFASMGSMFVFWNHIADLDFDSGILRIKIIVSSQGAIRGVEDDGSGLGRQDDVAFPSLIRTGVVFPQELGVLALVGLNEFF